MVRLPNLIGNDEVTSAATFPDHDPSSGELLAEVSRSGAAEVDAAVAAARDGFERHARMPAVERSRLLHRLAAGVRAEGDRLAALESRDVGKPLSQARNDVEVCARYFEFYAGVLEAVHGDVLPTMDGQVAYTKREPFGVTAHITPWNYPLQMVARTVAPALAAGNFAVLKPAEDTPHTSVELARIARAAGFPPGMFNVVLGIGAEAGAALAAHPGIDHIAFTGSRPVGSAIAAAAAANVIPAVLELGGKSPNLVFDDADLELAVPKIVTAITQNAGQTCSAGSRVLVHESVRDTLVRSIAERFDAMSLGPGIEDPDMGPLINAKQRERVEELVAAGEREARLVTGGARPAGDRYDRGFFYRPTLFDDVPPSARIAQEEIFGPVLAVTPFRDEDEAVRLANATDFGLVAALWTRDVTRAHRLSERVRAGQVFVNTYGAAGGVELPFGGWKRSGYGREKGVEALIGYTQTKTVVIGL